MDELTMLRSLGAELDHEPPATLARQRNRLPAIAGVRRPRWRLRVALAGAATIAVATGGALALQSADPGPAAATVLERAAAAAAEKPTPRPDQFVFTHIKDTDQEIMWWNSVDGSRTGVDRRNPPLWGKAEGRQGTWQSTWICDSKEPDESVIAHRPIVKDLNDPPNCPPQEPGMRTDLPTDPDAMLKRLAGERGDGAYAAAVWETAGDRLHDYVLLPPGAMAALFRALAKLPGTRVAPNVKDSEGRSGIGIAFDGNGMRETFILDKESYEFLGSTTTRDGTTKPTWESVIIKRAVVDRAGRMP